MNGASGNSDRGLLPSQGRIMHTWADSEHPIAQPFYDAMSGDFMHTFTKEYNGKSVHNFDKPGNNLSGMNANATVQSVWSKTNSHTTEFIVEMSMPDDVHTDRGAPATLSAHLVVPHSSDATGFFNLSYTLQWAGKTSTHAPETLWLLNRPRVSAANGWRLDKLGRPVNPLDADLGFSDGTCNPSIGPTTCGVHLHAVGDGGASYEGPEGSLVVRSLDSMLVSVGEPIAVPTPLKPPDALRGVHFSLVDNVWNTNYPTWYPFTEGDDSSQFRFVISIRASSDSGVLV